MKSQKLIRIAAISCVFLGVSGGAAMAEGCGDGLLQDETFEGNLVVRDQSCSIISSTIEGNLRVINSGYVLLLNNKVGGSIRIRDGGVANAIANTVFGGDLVVRDNHTANIIENETLTGNIRVIGNTDALVQKNIATRNLICAENTTLDAFVNFAGKKLDCD
jgi:hypothetical protein